MRTILFIFLGLISFQCITAQSILVNEEPAITKVMNDYLSKNQQETSIKGWRIQIITTPDRRKMQNAKNKFSSIYPSISLNWNHVPPYYKVVIGAWKDKFSCDAFLVNLKSEFPSAIPVIDDVDKVELIN